MATIALLLAASVGFTTAQLQYNATTNQFTCPEPEQAYCVSGSLQSNIIVRCDGTTIGTPGNCDDNLDGEPPMGLSYSPCWQTSNTTGDAACSKNCVVYGSSGNYNGTFTLPADQCTSTYTASSSAASATTTTASASATSSAGAITGSASGTLTVVIGTTSTTTECPETKSTTGSAGAVAGSSRSTSAPGVGASASATTKAVVPPTLAPGSGGANTTYTAGGRTTTAPGATSGAATTVTSTSSVASTSSSPFAVAGAGSNRVGAGLGIVGLIVGALI